MVDYLNYICADEEPEWLANIDPRFLDKPSEEKQLDDK